MKIAVLSGKGGTGKTLISVNLAAVIENSQYYDCDVEAPNGHLYLSSDEVEASPVTVKIPVVLHDKCTGCRACVSFCRFNALAYINGKVKVFETVCHSCGGCAYVCEENAIVEKEKVIGKIERRKAQNKEVVSGFLSVGEETGVPIIKKMLKELKGSDQVTIIDCPPGSSCMVMESIQDADYCVLVAEPTVFGTHNLEMVHELVRLFNKPHGVVLNKNDDNKNPSADYCEKNDVPIIGRIPFDIELGKLNAEGKVISNVLPRYRQLFSEIYRNIRMEVEK